MQALIKTLLRKEADGCLIVWTVINEIKLNYF